LPRQQPLRGKVLNTIEEFTLGGVGSVFANTGLSNPTFLAFNPTPEPSTWAMFAIGVVALLLTKRCYATKQR
jgi:hypothetical protein